MKPPYLFLCLSLCSTVSFSQTREDLIECLKTVLELPEMDPAFEQEWGEEKSTYLMLIVQPFDNLQPVKNPIATINTDDFRGFRRIFSLLEKGEEDQIQDLITKRLILTTNIQYRPQLVTIMISGQLPVYPMRYLNGQFVLKESGGIWDIEKQSVNFRAY